MSTPRTEAEVLPDDATLLHHGLPQFGHTYSTIATDVIRRYKRMRGFDVVMTTGDRLSTGVNVERSAKKARSRLRIFDEDRRPMASTLG